MGTFQLRVLWLYYGRSDANKMLLLNKLEIKLIITACVLSVVLEATS